MTILDCLKLSATALSVILILIGVAVSLFKWDIQPYLICLTISVILIWCVVLTDFIANIIEQRKSK